MTKELHHTSVIASAVLALVVVSGLAGCGRHAKRVSSEPTPAVQASTTMRPGAEQGMATRVGADTGQAALLAQGKQLVSTVCVACHTEQPPPKLAPPLAHVSQRYRMMHQGDRDKAMARIVAWIKAPAKEKSLMPAMAIDRFGLMAPLPLPDDQLRAAAAYLWSLSEGATGIRGMRNGMESGMGQGMGGQMRGMSHGGGMRVMKDTTDTN